MLHGGDLGHLTVRTEADGSRIISGRFPYNSLATLSDGGRRGRPRKERFKPRAFQHSVESDEQEINLLFGHDFDKPLASKQNGTLTLNDTAEALEFEARLSPEVAETTHAKDAIALIDSGLAKGISPGFRIPPERAVKNAEVVEAENPALGQALIRTINAAILYELSVVTRPAYPETQVEARNWKPDTARRPLTHWGYR